MASDIIEEFETAERHYTATSTQFIKRELLPSEYHTRPFDDKGIIVPSPVRERLENEKDAPNFIAIITTVPVPRVLDFREEDGICSLIVKRTPSTIMEELMYTASDEDKATLIYKVAVFIETIVRPWTTVLDVEKIEHVIRVRDGSSRGSDTTQTRAPANGGGDDEGTTHASIISRSLPQTISSLLSWFKTTKILNALYILFAPFRRWRPWPIHHQHHLVVGNAALCTQFYATQSS